MKRHTHGRCRPCGAIFQWQGRPLLRDALCPRCRQPLDRTAAGIARHIPIVEEHPVYIVMRRGTP